MFLFLIRFLFLTEVMFMACKDNLCCKVCVETDHAGFEFDSTCNVSNCVKQLLFNRSNNIFRSVNRLI